MPLVWAHAEHIKLLRSIRDGVIFDMPPQTIARYVAGQPPIAPFAWRLTDKRTVMAAGGSLRIELSETALVHWSTDAWAHVTDCHTRDTGFGIHICDLPTKMLGPGIIVFTIFWTARQQWEGTDFHINVI